MYRDIRQTDFNACLADLSNAGKIVLVNTEDGPAYIKKETEREAANNMMLDFISYAKRDRSEDEKTSGN